MNSFIAKTNGRILVIGLSKGDMLLESVESEAVRLGIKNGVLVSAIGTFSKAVFHMITTTSDKPEDKIVTVEKPIELSAVQGMIINSKPHFHMVFSDNERAYTGHLEPGCEILYLAELCILEIDDLPTERRIGKYGISYLSDSSCL